MVSAEENQAYVAANPKDRLFQGEILSNVVERIPRWKGKSPDGQDEFVISEVIHPFAVIATQDCDLEQDARARESNPNGESTGGKVLKALLPTLLLVVASDFDQAKDSFGGSDVRKRARQNKDERYQFLAAVPKEHDARGSALPSLVLDFKRFFAYGTDELLKAIERGETYRRARLGTPYAEHLSDRFGHFVQRVGLPRDHHDIEVGDQQPV